MGRPTLTVGAVSLALAAAVAGAAAQPRAGPTPAATESARVAAQRLVALVTPPAGALRVGAAPGLDDPPERPGVDGLIDRARLWRLPMSYGAAQEWLLAAAPAGLTSRGSGSGTSGGMAYRVFDGTPPDRVGRAELMLAVAPSAGATSYLRADGVATALDEHPYRDDAAGDRIRVAVDQPCPRTDAGAVGVTNPGSADLTKVLVPDATPTAARICRYAGANGTPFALLADKRVDGVAAARLVTAARGAPIVHERLGVHGCPFDDGAVTVISLAFPGRPDVDLWHRDGGCFHLANGHILAAVGDAGALGDALDREAPVHRPYG